MTEEIKRLRRVCFTGHRPEKLNRSEKSVLDGLETAIRQAIVDGIICYTIQVKLCQQMRRVRCANMSSSINENYISIEDAALFLNIKPVTLRKWIKDKNVPAHKIGKQWKFRRSELEEWVKSGKSAIEYSVEKNMKKWRNS